MGWVLLGAPGAPRERHAPAAGLYSGAMMMPPPYRPAATARKGPGSYVVGPEGAPVLNPAPSPVFNPATGGATGFRADYFSTGRFTSSSGKNFKMRNFGGVLSNFAPQGVPPGHSAPSPIVPAGKLNTTRTMLSSGEGLKKRNFVGIMLNYAPVLSGLTDQFPFFILHFSICILQFSLPAPAARSVRLSVSAPLPPAPVPRLLSGAVGRSRYYRGLLGPDEARPLFEDLDLDQVGVGDRSWAVIMNPPGFTGAVTPLCRPAPFRWREGAPPA